MSNPGNDGIFFEIRMLTDDNFFELQLIKRLFLETSTKEAELLSKFICHDVLQNPIDLLHQGIAAQCG